MRLNKKSKKALLKINKIINNYLKPFNCTAIYGTDFSYYPAYNNIEYTFIVSDKHSQTFRQFFKDNWPNIDADIFILSFFHELGHHETDNDIPDEEYIEYKRNINNYTDEEYYNNPIEFAASTWAAEYLISHAEEVGQFWNELAPAIQSFYALVEVK